VHKPIIKKRYGLILLAGALAGIFPLCSARAVDGDEAEQLKARFTEGYRFFEVGQYRKALSVFEAIRKVDPNARGSLFLSGMSYIQLLEFDKAVPCFDRFLRLEPDHVSGLIGAIKSNQALGNDEAVGKYRQKLFWLKSRRADKRLEVMINYEREIISVGGGERLSVLETFPDVESTVRYQGVLIKGKKVLRRLEWIRAEGAVKTAVDAIYPDKRDQAAFVLAEAKGENGDDYKMHEITFTSLDYVTARNALLKVFQP
jgi:tetratricopeptide (TPR) repeat protein